MSVSIAIVPLQRSVHMFGDVDRSSAYSLSGHVEITISPSFLSRRTSKFLLKSLELTFEGQCEVVAPAVGYSAVRLYTTTVELVPQDPVLLSDDGDEGSGEPCRWNAIFNINIPGWLPASSRFGLDDLGVSYRLFATAKYVDVQNRKRDSSSSSSWSFSSLYSAMLQSSGERVTTSTKNIYIKRFVGLPSEDGPEPVHPTTYLLNHAKINPSSDISEPQIPPEVISKVRILASVPEYIDIKAGKVLLILRLRTKDLPVEECKRLQLLGFRVDVLQRDKFRTRPSRDYQSRCPLPAEEFQPPNLPLRWTNRSSFSYGLDYLENEGPDAACSRVFSLLPPSEDGRYSCQNDNYVFAKDADATERPTWYTLQTNIPITNSLPQDGDYEWAGPAVLRPSSTGPLISVRHEITIILSISYDIPGTTQKAQQNLSFSIPIRLALPAPCISRPPCPFPDSDSCFDISSPFSSRPTTPPESNIHHFNVNPSNSSKAAALTATPVLPPYSQFYYSNGDRKIDPTPLPLYTPRGVSPSEHLSSSESSDDEDGDSNPVVLPPVLPYSQKFCEV